MRKTRPTTLPERKRIVELYEAGWSQTEVGRLVGRKISTVRTVLLDQGVELRPREHPQPRITEEECQQAYDLYQQGLTLAEISKAMGFKSGCAAGIRLNRVPEYTSRDASEAVHKSWEKRDRKAASRRAKRHVKKLQREPGGEFKKGA